MANVKEITVEVFENILRIVDRMRLEPEDILVLRVLINDPQLKEKVDRLRAELFERYQWTGYVMIIECHDDMVGKMSADNVFGLYQYLKERFHGEEWKMGGGNG